MKIEQRVQVWEEERQIPTYEVGEPNKNPMFLEKRVYQGSSGKVYPYPVIDKIHDHKKMKSYNLVIVENEYIRIEIMPELGGRIYRALDKTNNYDFVYYNRVIKPALVGLAGPWISGGIEFNWPQHHRPNTFGPVEYKVTENDDGSATVWVSEIDRMYGTKVTAGFILHPDKAYLEIKAQLYNRTSLPQTFLWWANPAVAVNDHTQSVFPPDVHAVFDHGKRDVSRFPIATGTYYKMDYSEGVDISRYKNIPVPTSYMAYKSDYDFVGGYDHNLQAGLLHVADHHISPGKKQWTWGNGDFGKAWDRQLTDEDGPYIELMTGVFTDNQPDFTWLQPYEEKTFTQYFMPYKHIGMVKNATKHAAVNLEVDSLLNEACISVYATSDYTDAIVELKGKKHSYLNEKINLSPNHTYKINIKVDESELEHNLFLSVKDAREKILVSYQPPKKQIEEIPEPAKPLPSPHDLKTTEELYLAGLHLEQYRHATLDPDEYYLEGLKREPNNIRINVAYGTLLLRRGLFKKSEEYFRNAIKLLTWRNPNPYDSEAYYQLGLSLKLQGKLDEAYRAFYKSVWSAHYQESGYFSLAQIASTKGLYDQALEFIEKALVKNSRNYKVRHLKTIILRNIGRLQEAKQFAEETITMDIADFGAYYELYFIHLELGNTLTAHSIVSELEAFMRYDPQNYLHLAADYEECGRYEEGIQILSQLLRENTNKEYPIIHYTIGYLYSKLKQHDQAQYYRRIGNQASSDYCFPNSLFELIVLEDAIAANPEDSKACYYLGNLLYDKKRYKEAIKLWETSREIEPSFATVHRNLALAYYNHLQDEHGALISLQTAFDCDQSDARVLYEYDQLHKKLGYSPDKRFHFLTNKLPLVESRDDLYIEYLTLQNCLGYYEKTIQSLKTRIFHPWEGGEGKVTEQYVYSHIELGKHYLHKKSYVNALNTFKKALTYPENLGEGKLEGTQDNNVYYYLGCAYEGLKDESHAIECFTIASEGFDEPASALYYNDQPPEMIFYQGLALQKLKSFKDSKKRFNKLIDYGEKHIFDVPKIDYFAVSLPDFLVFNDDLKKRNEIHCRYMRALGLIGLNKHQQAIDELNIVLSLDSNHQGAITHKKVNMITS
ncbi:DUF5107 domain-containing protein [Metabacillus litoralis]|uniref:DUF5107 domain-containing protein n=1 Tax=Metabacillus litoralis TaxID=152268 RepID=A0A5C6W5N3_9BACI|nr:DUF5107 domain-containing protein [Metabacillus litoralis]TXC92663.1 DUF5107 domain-containing protein [Metabacillus litoralis]